MTEHERAARYSDLFASGEGGRAESFGDRREHPSDCQYCPFCATVNVVRKTHPEVLEHLAAAARELITAAGIMIEEAAKAVAPPPVGESEGDEKPAEVRWIDAS